MAQIPQFQKQWCEKMIDRLCKRPIIHPFLQPVISDSTTNPGYLDKISEPMDMESVKTKLKANKYNSVADFARDVRLIWYNAQTYYPPDNAYHMIAKDLSKWFEKKLSRFPQTQDEKWLMRLRKAEKKVQQLLDTAPPDVPLTGFVDPKPDVEEENKPKEEEPKKVKFDLPVQSQPVPNVQ